MEKKLEFSYEAVQEKVLVCLTNLLNTFSGSKTMEINEKTSLVGQAAVVDSLGLVTLILDLEQSIQEDWGVSIALADEKAMSRRNSPFLTVESLTQYVWEVLKGI